MSVEDLLKPRVKCIADFWDNPFKVGEVIEADFQREHFDFFTGESIGTHWHTDFLPKGNKDVARTSYSFESRFFPYPHLFKPMQWWEEREESQLPEYVKYDYSHIAKVKKYHFLKTLTFIEFFYDINDYSDRIIGAGNISKCVPSTLQEYQTFKQQNK